MKGARILVVDDEAASREILALLLEPKGHRLVCVGSAEEARQKARAQPFDAILLDHVLPGITGLQALRELQQLSSAPIYLMSGYVDPDFQRDALLLGAAGFLSKPLDFAALERLLAALPPSA